jgi:alcohol dehydrogenase class IV
MPFQTLFDFQSPTRIIHGPGSLERLPDLVAGAKVLIVTDHGLVDAGVGERLIEVLDRAGISHSLYAGSLPNPPAACVHAGQRQYRKDGCQAIVALGGGSPMDVAKMIGVLVNNPGRIDRYLGAGKVKEDLPPLFCVPTTYGTGSEATPFAVLTNPKSRNKDPIISWKIAPQVGILDPELSVALPRSVGGPTGMDALTHALESYTNLLANPLTDALALQAIRLIGANIRLACANAFELAATENMLIASCLAGMAFSQTRLGNVHAMSHPVGAQFGVHHGLANAILLPYVMDFNLTACPEKFAIAADALGADTDGLIAYDAAYIAVDAVRQLNRDLGVPERLGQVGVKKSGIKALSRATMQSGNVAVNPRQTSQRDIEALFAAAI